MLRPNQNVAPDSFSGDVSILIRNVKQIFNVLVYIKDMTFIIVIANK